MIAVGFRFLAGRYHGTPWDRHVNEGSVEWPPSPWRILRALVAASYRLDTPPQPAVLEGLLEKLSSPPLYRLPPGNEAHTRHYMPTREKTTLVFDTFVAVGDGARDDAELVVAWEEAELTEGEVELLDALLDSLGYLGRSESWVEARRTQWDGNANVFPATEETTGVRSRIRLQAVLSQEDYATWRGPAAKRTSRRTNLPENLLEILHQETGQLHRGGWSEAPGTQWIPYTRPEWLTEVRPVAKPATGPDTARPTFARYAISSAVLPRLREAVAIGERFRTALMSRAGVQDAGALALFSGKDAAGKPLRGHRHAFFLPADDDADGRIDHLVVYAPAGFDQPAREALESLTRLWGRGGHDLHVSLIGLGQPGDYAPTREGGTALGASARVWESRTPVVLPRHPKRRGSHWTETPEDQLRTMLVQLGYPEPQEIERLACTQVGGADLPWFRFRRRRLRGGGSRAGDSGYGFRVTFAEPAQGPLAVGYGAHVGLGQFVGVG